MYTNRKNDTEYLRTDRKNQEKIWDPKSNLLKMTENKIKQNKNTNKTKKNSVPE